MKNAAEDKDRTLFRVERLLEESERLSGSAGGFSAESETDKFTCRDRRNILVIEKQEKREISQIKSSAAQRVLTKYWVWGPLLFLLLFLNVSH